MAALAAVEKVEVDRDRVAIAADPDGKRTAHLVDVEGFVALVALRPLDDLAGIRRDPKLGIDPGHLHLGGADLGSWKDAVGRNAVGVRLVLSTLIDRLGLDHHAVGAHLSVLRHLSADHDQVVELQVFVVLEDHPKLARRSVLGPKHAPNRLGLVGHVSTPPMVAARSSR